MHRCVQVGDVLLTYENEVVLTNAVYGDKVGTGLCCGLFRGCHPKPSPACVCAASTVAHSECSACARALGLLCVCT